MSWAAKPAAWVFAALLALVALPAAADDLQWTLFRSPEHGFSADFPRAPELTTSGTPGKDTLVQYEFQAPIGDNYAYEVAVLEFGSGYVAPKPGVDIYTKLIEGYAKGSDSTVRTQQPRTIAGLPGREAITDDDAHNMHHLVDFVIANGRTYIIVSAGPKGHETSADALRFRDSFALLDK